MVFGIDKRCEADIIPQATIKYFSSFYFCNVFRIGSESTINIPSMKDYKHQKTKKRELIEAESITTNIPV